MKTKMKTTTRGKTKTDFAIPPTSAERATLPKATHSGTFKLDRRLADYLRELRAICTAAVEDKMLTASDYQELYKVADSYALEFTDRSNAIVTKQRSEELQDEV